MSTLTVVDIRKSFSGVPVLRAVSLEATSGGITAVLGPSGCGKTTLLRLVAGFIRPDAGSIEIGGQEVSGPSRHVPPEARRLGYLAQEGALFPHLTVAENIAFGLPRRARRDTARLHRLLELVSLDAALLLPAGQLVRVAAARRAGQDPGAGAEADPAGRAILGAGRVVAGRDARAGGRGVGGDRGDHPVGDARPGGSTVLRRPDRDHARRGAGPG